MPKQVALLVGINYIGTPNELHGCVNDIENMSKMLQSKGGFTEKDITLLSDAYKGAGFAPTRDNVLNALKNMVREAKPGDTIFFHYSGHGTNSLRPINDYEAICPLNGKDIELIADFELHNIVKGLVPGARFISALDCCHSGDMFNLENNLNEKKLTHHERDLRAQTPSSSSSSSSSSSHAKAPKKHAKSLHPLQDLINFLKPSHLNGVPAPVTQPHGYVVVLSGCEIAQTSADAVIDRKPQGALTACILDTVERNDFNHLIDICLSGSKTLMKQLNDEMLAWMRENGYTQRPDFSFEGQLALANKAVMAPAQALDEPSRAEAKAFLYGFANHALKAAKAAQEAAQAAKRSEADTSEAAKNDEVPRFPTRKKVRH